MPKNAQTTTQLHSSHTLIKECSKFSKPGFNSMRTMNFHMFKLDSEKESYTYLNEAFQRIARRDKKAFLSDQCKERKENNRMGKTRDLFKKMGDTKGTFHARMGSIKDRYGRVLTEAEDINKRWQEYTEELYKNGLNSLDNHKVWSLT